MNPKIVTLIVGGNFLANLLLVGCSVQPEAPVTTVPSPTQETPSAATVTQPEERADIYSYAGKTFINLKTEERKNFIPEGYDLVSYQHGIDFPEYLILQKGNLLYRYTAKNHAVDLMNIRKIAQDERAWINPSVSDKNEFLITFNKGRPVEGMIDFEIDSTQRYYFNAAENKSSDAKDTLKVEENYTGCHEYDSKLHRIFVWTCGEGLGSIGPITAFDLQTQKTVPYLTNGDVGAKDDDMFRVWFDHGMFSIETGMWDNTEKAPTYAFVDISSPEPEITILTYNQAAYDKVKTSNNPYGLSPYSTLWIREKNLLAIGFANGVHLATITDGFDITDTVKLNDDQSYVNTMYRAGNHLYYRFHDGIRVINLDTKQLEKTIEARPGDGSGEDIGLIAG